MESIAHGGSRLVVKNVMYHIIRRDPDGHVLRVEGPFKVSNLTLDGGLNVARQQLHDPSYATGGKVACYVGVTVDAVAPNSGDTTLASEETTNGLARTQALYSNLGSTGAWQLQVIMTYVGAPLKTLAKMAVFDDPTAGNVYYEALLSPTAPLNTNDIFVGTWQGAQQAA
jgi:hypothetical protein